MRRRLNYRGRVQGVGFRATARSIARAHPVTGWVRNEPDGTVTLEVQGAAGAVDRYLDGLFAEMGRNITGHDTITLSDQDGEAGFVIAY
jgi:acylphosphatase